MKLDGKTVIRFLWGFVALFPFLMMAGYSLAMLSGAWEFLFGTDKIYGYFFLPRFLDHIGGGMLVFALWIGVACAAYRWLIRLGGGWRLCLLFVLTVALRAVLPLVFFEAQPFSDFGNAWRWGVGLPIQNDWHQFFPAWQNWSLFIRGLRETVGIDYVGLLLLCAVANAITAVCIYRLADRMIKSKNLALLASLLYVFNPSSAVYCMTSSPEHVAIACFMMFVATVDDGGFGWGFVFRLLASSVILGLGNSFKPFLPVIGIAVLLTDFYAAWLRRRPILILWAAVVVVVAAATTSIFSRCSVERYAAGMKCNPLGHFLLVGLNREGQGQIHVGSLSRGWMADMRSGMKDKDANERAIESVINSWEGHVDELPVFFASKMAWAWQDDYRPFGYFKDNMDLRRERFKGFRLTLFDFVNRQFAVASQIWYFALGVICCLVAVGKVFKSDEFSISEFFILLMIAGYFGLIVFSEAQSRYKCLIIPYLCLVAAEFGILRRKQ